MLEGRCRGKAERLLELLYELVGVEGVQEVDEAGSAAQYLDGEVAAVLHIDPGRLLVGVAAVFKFEFFHECGSLFVLVNDSYVVVARFEVHKLRE